MGPAAAQAAQGAEHVLVAPLLLGQPDARVECRGLQGLAQALALCCIEAPVQRFGPVGVLLDALVQQLAG